MTSVKKSGLGMNSPMDHIYSFVTLSAEIFIVELELWKLLACPLQAEFNSINHSAGKCFLMLEHDDGQKTANQWSAN